MTQIATKLSTFVSITVLGAALPAFAEQRYGPGVSDTEIKIGQTMPYSGPLSAYAGIGRAQAAYLAKINAEGGVNGRKITLISLDDGYNPAKTAEHTRRLIEQEEVLLLFGSFGTPTNSAVQKYVNAKGVPQLFLVASSSKWADPRNHPWSMGWTPAFKFEAAAFARYLLQKRPEAKVGVLYQNDDSGKDFLAQFKQALGERAAAMIVAAASYEPSDPSVDTQIISLKASGADTFVNVAFGKAAAQAIRKAHDIGWKPLQLLTMGSSPVEAVLKPAGLERATGIISTAFVKDPADPQWKDDAAMRDWRAWMERYHPNADPADIINVVGYSMAQTLVHVLKQCGDDLSRENVMRQAANLKSVDLPMLLPGVKLDTATDDYFPIEQLQMMRFDGKQWVRFGEVAGKRQAARN